MSDTDEMSRDEFDTAADTTKIGKTARAGAMMVLVGGATPAQAGREAGTSRQTIHAAVKVIRKAYESIHIPAGCRLVKVWLPLAEADEVESRCRKNPIPLKLAYPANIEQDEDGRFVVTFPDLPYGTTDGATLEEARIEAADCLDEVLAGMLKQDKGWPTPSKGEIMISVSPGVVALLS